MITLQRSLLALLLAVGGNSQAQELLPLDAGTEHRLGLVFTRLAAPDQQAGAVVPAQVISSPLQQSSVVALYGGVLESWVVQPGYPVAAGEVLGLLRSPQVLELQQNWLEAHAAEQLASAALQRDQRLLADGVIAASREQQTRREQQAASSRLQALGAQLQQAGFAQSDLTALTRPGAQLGLYRIVAREAGLVAHLQLLPGAAVNSGDALLSISSDSVWISAEVPARLATVLAEGQALRVEREAAALILRQRDQSVDAATQTIGILAEFIEPVSLLPGQLVSLVLPATAQGVLVPADAVVRNGSLTSVYVRSAGGVESRVLQLQVLGSDYLATSGVSAGEEVVIRGAALLKGIQLGLGGE